MLSTRDSSIAAINNESSNAMALITFIFEKNR